jgi:hypothetical protein
MFKKIKKILTVGTVFTAAANLNACAYGPPPDSIRPDKNTDTTTVKTTEYDPSENENPAVYGPPEYFDPSSNQNGDVYGPPEDFGFSEPEEDFDPSLNENRCVYGPPEMMVGSEDE